VVFLAALALGRFAVNGLQETADPADPAGEGGGYDYGEGGFGPGYRPARDPAARPGGSGGTTQPMAAPSMGRYARETGGRPADPPPYQGGLPDPTDRHVAGETHDPRA
jgi:hypothetical protein